MYTSTSKNEKQCGHTDKDILLCPECVEYTLPNPHPQTDTRWVECLNCGVIVTIDWVDDRWAEMVRLF